MSATERLAAETEPATKVELTTERRVISAIGADMVIVGTIQSQGPVQVYGHLKGELVSGSLLIGATGHVEGNVAAEDVTVLGAFSGTIRAAQVKLLGRASVAAEIFHQQLSMEEEVSFDGSSRPLAPG
jgi:cytoskeletal protein CcmA (bactofilin family)